MVLKRKINYQLKLFLPLALTLWLIILVFAIIQDRREKDFLTQSVSSRIDFINRRVLDFYDNDEDPTFFINFLDKYYLESALHDVSVAVYDTQTGELIHDMGIHTPPPESIKASGQVRGYEIGGDSSDKTVDPDSYFYYAEGLSDDGRILVQTVLPFSTDLSAFIKGNGLWWALIIAAGIFMTIVTYLATLHLSRNVKFLRRFVTDAVEDRDFVAVDRFANDDLGEISRQIINIYNARNAAISARELEHKVALKATIERSNLKRQLTNNISHELKTPVGIIRGYVDTLVDNPDMDESSRAHFLSKTQSQVERLCNLLNDLSTITRLDEGTSKVTLEEIDFNDFMANFALEVEGSGIAGDMKFSYDIPDGCVVKANNSLINGALMNLVKNAVNYSRGTEMGIKLLTQNNRYYTFVFYDNGVGVGEEHIPMLFDRFYRVDMGRSRKIGGTGLGLPIVRSSINTMGGTISVRNRKGGGLEFIFTLNRWRVRGEKNGDNASPTA